MWPASVPWTALYINLESPVFQGTKKPQQEVETLIICEELNQVIV